MQLNFLELDHVLLSFRNFILHLDLLTEVFLLNLFQFTNLQELLLVASQCFTHGQLVLILTIFFAIYDVSISNC